MSVFVVLDLGIDLPGISRLKAAGQVERLREGMHLADLPNSGEL